MEETRTIEKREMVRDNEWNKSIATRTNTLHSVLHVRFAESTELVRFKGWYIFNHLLFAFLCAATIQVKNVLRSSKTPEC